MLLPATHFAAVWPRAGGIPQSGTEGGETQGGHGGWGQRGGTGGSGSHQAPPAGAQRFPRGWAGMLSSSPSTDAGGGGAGRRPAAYWLRQPPKRCRPFGKPGPASPPPRCRLPGAVSAWRGRRGAAARRAGSRRPGLRGRWPRGTRSPPPASAPRGLVVVAAAEGPRGRCVPRHCRRNVLTFRGDGRERTAPPAQVGAGSRRGDASGAAAARGAGRPKARPVFGGRLRRRERPAASLPDRTEVAGILLTVGKGRDAVLDAVGLQRSTP